MRIRRFEYPTRDLAEAFEAGVSYVNDSAIQTGIEEAGPELFVVIVRDSDYEADEED